MAKEKKKRGFFSWLGLGRQEEEQQQPQEKSEIPETPVAEPAADVEPHPAAEQETSVAEPLENQEPAEQPPAPQVAEEAEEETLTRASAPAEEIAPAAEVAVVATPHADEEAKQDEDSAVPAQTALTKEDEPAVEDEAEDARQFVHDAPAMHEQERPTREGFFARLKRSLVKTRQNLGSGFIGLFRGKKIDDDLFEELEEQLLIADVGVDTTRKIIASLTEHANRKQLKDADTLFAKLKEEMATILAKVDEPLNIEGKTPYVILMVGVNGVGKTTTIGKMARQFQAQGKSVMLAAGDTFRAAAVEQLQVWGQRNNVAVVAQHTGADSASVIFDAIQAAKARGVDVLIADTAGRLQNKAHLMEELKKIVRVMKKLDEEAPHEVMLTLDASTGQNAVSQAKLFNEAVGLTGISLTKLDGTAKGGVIFAIADQFGIPIRYIGVGEGIEDLRPFKADDFIEALFARED
ncbi:signal recognition particle-docking protein FtsY [Brenneria sp. g21c3]|uniref:signal recognition particle-docking protein FtsY n=1 Tax=Brenneria sp. g21c3 TaxID=3093893 RepID=UPI002EB3DFC3|nr:signal recognition particle-docking protein FtsY [Brenneria sp. g21c3]